jgi:NADPH-dependent 2,4-dienoyl-CoA reductase/sulfur reductase-like enzyme
VRPNIGFLEHSGVRCLVGVLTDEHLQTNVPGIYAAGDCAEAFDKVSGKTIVSAIQPNAAEQARVAALNMVGQRAELRGVTQINVLDTLGLISASFGDWEGVPGGEHVELTDRGRPHLSLQFSGDAGGLQQRRLDRARGRDARPGRRPGAGSSSGRRRPTWKTAPAARPRRC